MRFLVCGSHLAFATFFVVGEHSEFRRFVGRFAHNHRLHFECFRGGSHLFPLEYPEATAVLLRRLLVTTPEAPRAEGTQH